MHIDRVLYNTIKTKLGTGKAILILGPRQVGKSTLLKRIGTTFDQPILHLDCDDLTIKMRLEVQTLPNLRNIIGPAKLVLIDEAQRVKNIGLTLKIITDQMPDVQLMVSGSSAFELANEINEPLTGRKWEYLMLPISTEEMIHYHGGFTEERNLESRLLFGMYPEVVKQVGNEREVLLQLANSYLYKDIFTFQDLRRPELIDKLLKALASQIGSESTYNKLAEIVGSDKATVQRYIHLLEKAFIIFRLGTYSKNIRTELKKSRKFYFYDCGIRNAIMGDFRPLSQRNDVGGLWENFLISERLKYNSYHQFYGHSYFWRTTQQQEIDYIEEYDGQLYAYEFKWNSKKKASIPSTFSNAYPNTTFKVISPENYQEFLSANML